MTTVVESVRLHLGVTGSAELGDGLIVICTLEDLHVVHQGLITLSDNGLILRRTEHPELGSSTLLTLLLCWTSWSLDALL